MGNISKHEGAYAITRNNFINLGKTGEIKEGVINLIHFLCSEAEPPNWLQLMQD